MNPDTLNQATKILGIDPSLADALSRSFAMAFDPQGPHAARITANALEALLALNSGPAEVHFVPNLAAFAERFAPDATAYHAYEGPVLLVQSPKSEHTLAFAGLPGARAVVVGVLPRAPLVETERLSRIRNLSELPRHLDHPGFEGAPIPAGDTTEEFEREVAQAAVLAYHQILKDTPKEVSEALEDFPGQVEDEIRWAAGLKEFPRGPAPQNPSPRVEKLADRIASEAFLILLMIYYLGTNQATLYLLERFGRLVPDRASEPGVLAVAPMVKLKMPWWLRRALPKLKVNYAVPLRATVSERGVDALASEPPYFFDSEVELRQLVKELGGTPMPNDPIPSVSDILDAILEKKDSPGRNRG